MKVLLYVFMTVLVADAMAAWTPVAGRRVLVVGLLLPQLLRKHFGGQHDVAAGRRFP
jgi:hypothetical protein